MPLTPLNNDFLQCPICFNAFSIDRKPVTLACCHTCCSACLKSLQCCPFDPTPINHDFPENEAIFSLLPINSANLLGGHLSAISGSNNQKLVSCFGLGKDDLKHYRLAIDCIQSLGQLIKPQNSSSNLLSRPMQRKLISLLHCQLVEGDGRLKAVKFCRSIGERITSELLLKHQDPYTLSANLWAAVRSRGCQFLGPALQEEILKLVLSALEDGSHLSRKVLVMFVVQRLSPHFPHQASKTAIGHVIQLLYRASCFRLTKRDSDSSLMQLKDEYCSYEALRREHDTQIVSIALESGLKISPDQWSSFLYGSPAYKSHMQSIIDKLQSPQSFNQSIQELIIALQRTQDPANLIVLKDHLERLAKIESATENVAAQSNDEIKDSKEVKEARVSNGLNLQEHEPTSQQKDHLKEHQQYPSYEELSEILDSCKVITFRLVDFLKQYNTLFSNVFRFSRNNSSFGNTGKFNKNGKIFNGKPKSPINEDAQKLEMNGQTVNPFASGSINGNSKTMQLSHGHLSNGINSVVNTTTIKLDYSTTNSLGALNSIDTMNSLNKMNSNKLKPCAFVPPTVLQQNGNFNGGLSSALTSTLNSSIKTTCGASSFAQHGYYSKLPNKTFNGKLNGPVLAKMNGNAAAAGLMNGSSANGPTNGQSNGLSNGKAGDYLKIDSKASFYSAVTNENQKNNQNIQNNQQQLKNHQLSSPVLKSEPFDVNHLSLLVQSKQRNGHRKSNQNSFSFDDGDDQFIPFADQPNPVSKFGPISRLNMINTQTVTGSNLKADNLNGSMPICKNTNVVQGALPSLIRPFNSSLFISNESCVNK